MYSSEILEDVLKSDSTLMSIKADCPTAAAFCEELDASVATSDAELLPNKKRIGRPRGSKNKPKRGRPRKSKRKSPPKSTSEPQRQKIIKNWERYLVKVNDTICENKPLLTIRDRLLVSSGGIVAVTGKPKSYKTFFTSAIIGAFINGEYMGIIAHNKGEHPMVLLCDTEQGRARTQIVAKRVQRICGMTTQVFNRNMRTISLREISSNERLKVLIEAIYDIKPKLVVVDGIRDLIDDFNCVQESHEVICQMMRAASEVDCAIVVVIHLNKVNDDARGHLGTEINNKSETVIELKSNRDGTVIVLPKHCRDIAFEELAFRISNDGLPVLCTTYPKSEEDKAMQKRGGLENLALQVFDNCTYISRKEMMDAIVAITKLSPKTAGRRIDDMLEAKVIELNPDNSFSMINQ